MYKSCSRCGKIHDTRYKCNIGRIYNPSNDSLLRNTNKWHKKAEEIKQRSNYLCELCKEQDNKYTYDDLEVHHIDKIRDKPERMYDDYNLICLCKRHHIEVENNINIKDNLFELVRQRENK